MIFFLTKHQFKLNKHIFIKKNKTLNCLKKLANTTTTLRKSQIVAILTNQQGQY